MRRMVGGFGALYTSIWALGEWLSNLNSGMVAFGYGMLGLAVVDASQRSRLRLLL
jgi:hypothetical protein